MPSSRRHLVIIGAGIAGLSAGCYAARSGYRTTILEMHSLPGGLCTSWHRKGYLFDGSVAGLATRCARSAEGTARASAASAQAASLRRRFT